MKIIFFGSDELAVVSLDRLIQSGHDILACVTQPDRPKGRGLKIEAMPVKDYAQGRGLPVLQPENLNDGELRQQLEDLQGDLFVVIAYGKILPAALLRIPPLGAVNLHGSLLPKYRGAAPINWAIINGEDRTGVTVIRMNEAMDAGEIILQEAISIGSRETAVTLKERLAGLGAGCLCRAVDSLANGSATFTPQEEGDVTCAPKLTKKMGLISWTKPARDIHNLVRGLLPWPGAYTCHHGKILKILETEVVEERKAGDALSRPPGTVTEICPTSFSVATGDGRLIIKKVHPEASRAMDARSFISGHRLEIGFCFSG